MRKHTKVLVGMIAVISLVIGMAIPTFAADEGKLAVTNDSATEEDGVYTLETENGTISWAFLDNNSVQDKKDEGGLQLGLKPQELFEADAYIEFTFEVDTEADYELTLSFAGDNTNRKANFTVDGKNSTPLNVKGGMGWGTQTQTLTVKLSAGEHKVRFTNDEAYDGSTVKAVNVIAVEWKAATPAVTDAPTTDAPTTDAPTTDAPTTDAPTTDAPTTDAPTTGKAPTAPSTGFVTVALVIAAVGSGAYVISKKH